MNTAMMVFAIIGILATVIFVFAWIASLINPETTTTTRPSSDKIVVPSPSSATESDLAICRKELDEMHANRKKYRDELWQHFSQMRYDAETWARAELKTAAEKNKAEGLENVRLRLHQTILMGVIRTGGYSKKESELYDGFCHQISVCGFACEGPSLEAAVQNFADLVAWGLLAEKKPVSQRIENGDTVQFSLGMKARDAYYKLIQTHAQSKIPPAPAYEIPNDFTCGQFVEKLTQTATAATVPEFVPDNAMKVKEERLQMQKNYGK